MLVLKGYNVILVEKYRIKRDVNQMINQALEVEYFTGINHSMVENRIEGGM